MCGIVGILNRDLGNPVDREILGRMTDLMAYRGPDERGTFVEGNVGLGHRRLSIIDLASGQQPMAAAGRSRVITYNGEIYNYRSLADSALKGKGVRLRTSSDTEVLLELAEFDDLTWLESLNGMFAFALWDQHTRSLLLARDRLGIKPLYYVDLGHSLIFASEIKPLLLVPGVGRHINETRIPEYLAFRSTVGAETLFKGVSQLPPGHVMILQPRAYRPRIERYWREGVDRDASQYADPARPPDEQFMEIFGDAVKSRLVSDVPVGTFNSGGVDSSLVTAVVRSLKADDLHTFSVGFEESGHDESRYAALVSRRYHTRHHALVVSESDYCRQLERTVWHLEEPINHPHSVQLLLVSELAKRFVTVVLTGEGADEVFGGYPRYRAVKAYGLLKCAPAFASTWLARIADRIDDRRTAKLALGLGKSETEQAVYNAMFVPARGFEAVLRQRLDISSRKDLFDNPYLSTGDAVNRLLYYEQRTYLPSLLGRLDRTSMAASVEGRVPFLDFRLVEWSYKLGSDLKIKGLVNKWLIRKAARRWLPAEIIDRKKVGFDVPVGHWLRNKKGLGAYLDLLRDGAFRRRGYFNHGAVVALIEEHLQGRSDHAEILWGLIGLELWCREFIDRSLAQLAAGPGAVGVAQ